jgi:hypothetical protein
MFSIPNGAPMATKKPKKPASEWTNEDIAKAVFPKKVCETLKSVAHEKDKLAKAPVSVPAAK